MAPPRRRSRSRGCWRSNERILLIPGTSSVAHLEENLAAAEVELDGDDLAALADYDST